MALEVLSVESNLDADSTAPIARDYNDGVLGGVCILLVQSFRSTTLIRTYLFLPRLLILQPKSSYVQISSAAQRRRLK